MEKYGSIMETKKRKILDNCFKGKNIGSNQKLDKKFVGGSR
jgi:hypothetical protein